MGSPLSSHLVQLARRVAQHEMGHYVVARALGFRTGKVSVEITGPIGHRGATEVTLAEALASLRDVQSYIERRVQVLYAGAPAETLQPHAPNKIVDCQQAVDIIRNPGQGAEQDYAKARELIHVLRNIKYPGTDANDAATVQGQLDAIDADLWAKAVALVETHAEAIIGLAGNLASRIKQPRELATLEGAYLESLEGVKSIRSQR